MIEASKGKKHISLIIPSLTTGGAERVFSILANSLISDYNITIFVLYKCEIAYSLNNSIEVVFCKGLYNPKLSIFNSVSNHYGFIKFLRKEISKRQSKLMISFTTTTNVYTVLVSKLLKVPSIISERLHPDYGINSFWKFIRKKIYPSSSKLVVQTQISRAYFNNFMGAEKVTIIENPIAPELTNHIAQNLERVKNILCVGRLTYQKNQDLLLKAFSKIDTKDWKLVFVGDGDKRKEYENLAAKLNIENKVVFTGSVQNVTDYLKTASIFVLCSRFEGFPNALIEAMYFGLPCIATNCPSGPEDIIINKKNGILISVDDENALTTALNSLIANEELREVLGKTATNTAKRFEADTIMNTWKTLIKSVME